MEVAQGKLKLHHAQKRGRFTFRGREGCESYLCNVEHDIVLTNHRHVASSSIGVVTEGVERSAHSLRSEQLRRGNTGRSPEPSYLFICYLAFRTTNNAPISPCPPDIPQAFNDFIPSCSEEARICSPFRIFYSFYFVLLYPSWASRPPTRTRRYHYRDLSLHLLYSPFIIIPSVHEGYRSFCAPFPLALMAVCSSGLAVVFKFCLVHCPSRRRH